MEYNALTKKLLAEGYSAENYPDHVQVDSSRLSGDDPLNNLGGGFVYKRSYTRTLIYKTGCGKYVKGDEVLDQMGYMGVEWCHENDNPVFRCPYDEPECQYNDPLLYGIRGGGLCIQCYCTCHRTEEPYDYENSIEKANHLRKQEKERKKQAFIEAHHGRVCERHLCYDERKKQWLHHYDPSDCARICYAQGGYCPVLGRKLDTKKGNVFYDLRIEGVQHYPLYDEPWATATKGMQVFDKAVSMDICRAYVKLYKEGELEKYYRSNHSTEFLFDKTRKVTVLNMRAEQRMTRDLIQDLQDIRDGIFVSYEPDLKKAAAEDKRKRRNTARQRRVRKMEKRILQVGYEELEEFEKRRADKLLSTERIEELEEQRLEPVIQWSQMTLF